MQSKQKLNILVVDDSLTTRETIKNLLSTLEGDVLAAASGEEALDILKSGFRPNLVILDLKLPGISGAEVVEKLRTSEKWRYIPVIPFSALWSDSMNAPFQKDLQIVRDWMKANRTNEKVGGGLVDFVTPKYQGQEDTNVVHPKLVISVARVLIQQGLELAPAFLTLLRISERQISE